MAPGDSHKARPQRESAPTEAPTQIARTGSIARVCHFFCGRPVMIVGKVVNQGHRRTSVQLFTDWMQHMSTRCYDAIHGFHPHRITLAILD
jgi:hypothetical protein